MDIEQVAEYIYAYGAMLLPLKDEYKDKNICAMLKKGLKAIADKDEKAAKEQLTKIWASQYYLPKKKVAQEDKMEIMKEFGIY